MTKLEPCPFCGGAATVSFSKFSVICTVTICRATQGMFKTQKEAIKTWNTRALPKPTIITRDESTWPKDGQKIVYRRLVARCEWSEPCTTVWTKRGYYPNGLGYIWWDITGMFDVPDNVGVSDA